METGMETHDIVDILLKMEYNIAWWAPRRRADACSYRYRKPKVRERERKKVTMAGTAKKSTKPAAKATETAEVKAIEPKTEEIKTEEAAQPKATVTRKTSAKKEAAPKAAAKETAVRETTPKAAAKQTAAKEKKTPGRKPAAKKAAEKCSLQIQYGGKSYSQEDLIRIAKDVWKYDLKRKAGELSDIELYVKPEENKVYYVMNGEAGSFDI